MRFVSMSPGYVQSPNYTPSIRTAIIGQHTYINNEYVIKHATMGSCIKYNTSLARRNTLIFRMTLTTGPNSLKFPIMYTIYLQISQPSVPSNKTAKL